MLILKFLPWHYFNGNKFILKLISNLVAFSFHLFSVKFLLKTLFAPWHRVEIVKQDAGFSFQKMFDKLTFNLISRSIGFVVRSIFIIFSLVLALLFVLIGILIFILWQFIPFLSWPLFYLSQFKEKGGSQKLTGEAKEFVFKRLGIKTQEEYLNSSAEDIKAIWQWYLDYQKKNKKTGQFWEKENLFKIRSIGADLAYGFTPNLDKYCQDLSIPTPFSHQLIGREKEIKQLEAIFTRSSQNNVLLVGEPGVGKHTILQGFAKAIKENKTHPSLFHKRVLELNMTAILGQSPASGEVKDKFSLLLKEAVAAGNIILVIDQLDKYVSGANEIDLTSVLTPIFQNQKVFVVGTTTPANFEKFIFPNSQ